MTHQPTTTVPLHPASAANEWWRSAVIYQIYPRSFADANGDGIGDLPGITSRLPYLRDLGVDALWVSPFYPSPQADAGYDVADYRGIDPLFGTLEDADTLIGTAHELGLRVFVDLVPNHTSDEHLWFQRALAAGPRSPERDWYIFRDRDPNDPDRVPNNWQSDFGGP
ncbi:MAG: alpha-amylase, partial [Ruaniaceae bacterium]|nr:alpha-amylase [Ruaniaceae bacterium]